MNTSPDLLNNFVIKMNKFLEMQIIPTTRIGNSLIVVGVFLSFIQANCLSLQFIYLHNIAHQHLKGSVLVGRKMLNKLSNISNATFFR